MGLFSKIASKRPKSPDTPQPPPKVQVSKTQSPEKSQPTSQKSQLDPTSLTPSSVPKRLSTFAEDVAFSDFEHDDYDDSSEMESEPETDDSYEEHSHIVFEHKDAHSVSQLSALMGFCGLGDNKESLRALANEESKRTFSLLSDDLKIHRLACTMSKTSHKTYESVIGDTQLHTIKQIKLRIKSLLDENKSQAPIVNPLSQNKTLFDRYGTVKDIIGRGAYGVIKIVDSPTAGNIYAVKELQKRPPAANKVKETDDQLVDRVVSEFILSSTLNNKNIVRTLDLMITLPKEKSPSSQFYEQLKFCQVMECTSGGDLFSYCKKAISSHSYISIDEVDCISKQITKGLWYMHNHGVAHCDLKLENILIMREKGQAGTRGRMNVKISDFGKSNVFRTKWDNEEQPLPSSSLPIGSQHYIAPEEHLTSSKGVSLSKKDSWALGVIIMILFNVRRSYYYDSKGACPLQYYDPELGESNTKTYGSAYLWQTTEPKSSRSKRYKDAVFDEYVQTRMISQYSPKTKEWSIQQKGSFIPIETIFDQPPESLDPDSALYHDEDEGFEEDDFDIRKYCVYKLLDMDPKSRFSPEALLKSDWLSSVETCGD